MAKRTAKEIADKVRQKHAPPIDHNASVVKLTTETVIWAQWGYMDGSTFVPRAVPYTVSRMSSESYHAEEKAFVEVDCG